MTGISTGAVAFVFLEALFFVFLVYSIKVVNLKFDPILADLSKSLKYSEDLFGDKRNFVTSARTRYRRAAERIEDVDAHAIASGELSSYEALRIWKWRISVGALAEIMGSAPGVFISIGLLGTFLGLALNLNELSGVLSLGNGESTASPGYLVDRMGGILAPMSTAFVSSLGGVFFSLLFWLTGLVTGANRFAIESESLLVAYLEQIVQADCNRFSLIRASVARMELCLSEFMSKFSERVGMAIDNAMSRKVEDVFAAIKTGSDALSSYAKTMDQGVDSLAKSGILFHEASRYFRDSSFPDEFGRSVDNLQSSTEDLCTSANKLSRELKEISACKELMKEEWKQAHDAIIVGSESSRRLVESSTEHTKLIISAVDGLAESSKQLKAARLTIGKDNKLSDELSRSLLNELEKGKSERNSQLIAVEALVSQLENRKVIDAKLATLIESNLRVDSLSEDERRKLMVLVNQLCMTNPGAQA